MEDQGISNCKCSNLLDGTRFLSNCLPVAGDAAKKDAEAEGPRVLHPFSSLPISPPRETRTCMHACMHACMRGSGEVPSFTSPSWRTPSRSIIIAHHCAKRRRCRGKQEAGPLPHCSSRLLYLCAYRQTCLSLSDRGQLCLPQDNQERVLPGTSPS